MVEATPQQPLRLLLVVWHDAHAATTGWTCADDIEVGFVVESVGWQLEGHDGHLVLAQSVGESQVDHVLAIPTGMIVRVQELVPR